MPENNIWKFTCPACEGHDLIVRRVYDILTGPYRERWQEWGPLEEDHHWHYEEKEKIAEFTEEEERGPDERKEDTDSVEFYVNCADCDLEIEFGWSHPGRAGRIWPAECSDFNSWKCWPEPRYREAWIKKDWIRPGDYSLD